MQNKVVFINMLNLLINCLFVLFIYYLSFFFFLFFLSFLLFPPFFIFVLLYKFSHVTRALSLDAYYGLGSWRQSTCAQLSAVTRTSYYANFFIEIFQLRTDHGNLRSYQDGCPSSWEESPKSREAEGIYLDRKPSSFRQVFVVRMFDTCDRNCVLNVVLFL